MNNYERIEQYKNGLITFSELQSLLRKQGYELKDQYNTGRYYLLPAKPKQNR